MPSGDIRSVTVLWKPRVARAALWALFAALAFFVGVYIGAGIESLGAPVSWHHSGLFTPYAVSLLMLTGGLTYASLLGFIAVRSCLVGWRSVARFSVLAMPWFVLAYNAGVATFAITPDVHWRVAAFLPWFAGLSVGGIWLTLTGRVFFPFLRVRPAFVRLIAGGVTPATLAGAMAVFYFEAMFEALLFVVAGWCAGYAAAFFMALPKAR